MTQGTLIRKLCTYTTANPTRRAVLEFDKLIRGIYMLRYQGICATLNWSAMSIARRTASSPTTSYVRPSPTSAARRN